MTGKALLRSRQQTKNVVDCASLSIKNDVLADDLLEDVRTGAIGLAGALELIPEEQ